MTDTVHLALPLIAAAQAQKHVTHNEALRSLDALVMLSVLDRDHTAPPGSPTDGARYLVKPTGTGAFAGKNGQLAHFRDGAWAFHTPRAGWIAHVAEEGALLVHDGSDWQPLLEPMREKLTAARTYYVRTDGSDSHDGLTNTSGGAFLTIQKALDVVLTSLDLGGCDVTIQIADGTYNASCGGSAPLVGSGRLTIQGNSGTPGNVIINGSNGALGTFWASNGLHFVLKDLEVRNAYTHSLYARWGGVIDRTNIRHGTSAGGHVVVSYFGLIRMTGPCTVTGNAVAYIFAHSGCVRNEYQTTYSGTPAFSMANIWAIEHGEVNVVGATFVGSATGKRFRCDTHGTIIGQTSLTAIPGSLPGEVESGGLFVHGASWGERLYSWREKLNAARTYYVRPDGNNANDGLADTSGGAFLTIQKAVDVVFGSLDLGGYDVGIQVADGTYTAGVVIDRPQVGLGKVIVKGNASAPANVLVSLTSANAFFASMGAALYVRDLKIQTATSGIGLLTQAGGVIRFQNIDFGACAGNHIRSADSGWIGCDGNYTISGSATVHWSTTVHGVLRCQGRTITVTGTPGFSTAFAVADLAGSLVINGNTFSGSATGARYSVATNGIIFTGGAGASYLPGDASGTTATGAQYA